MTVISKTEFAARRGWSKSYVSKLASQDRLVLTVDDKIDLEATEALLAKSADPSKAAVAARHQKERIQRGVHTQLSPEVEPTSTAAPQPAIITWHNWPRLSSTRFKAHKWSWKQSKPLLSTRDDCCATNCWGCRHNWPPSWRA